MDQGSELKIAIACDHAGYALKEEVKRFLLQEGYTFQDFGTFSEAPVDYPDYALKVGRLVKDGSYSCGILICSSGIGMSIAANKIQGIRAALCHDTFSAKMAREHNHANILCLGGKIIGEKLALQIVKIWLESSPSNEVRHLRRLKKVSQIEKDEMKG